MTTSPTRSPAYEQCLRLAEEGDHARALEAYEAYLDRHPDDGRALNDTGALLYALGRCDEAADHLRRAADRLGDERGQALWNLAEVLLRGGRPAEVLALFDDLEAEGLLCPDLANRAATAFGHRGDRAGALEAVLRSLRLDPNQEALKPAYQAIRSQRPKVAFLCEFPDTKFLRDLFNFVGSRFETRLAQPRSQRDLADLLDWCDVAWLEWCTNQAVVASQLPKACRTIVRLHRFEAYTAWPEQVRWEHIDALVTVGNPATLEHLRARIPGLEGRTRVVPIPNGVNLERFAFADRPRGKNLAWVGYLNDQKNPTLLLQCFQKLHAADPEYRLFFAGEFQDSGVLEGYLRAMLREMGLEDAVRFDGWQEDVAAWLEDKHYLVTSSLVEGHPVGVLEGMARGLKPVVHTFPGCRAFFPDEFLYRTVDEFCGRVLDDPYEPERYRSFVAERFSLERQLAAVDDLLLGFERDIEAGKAAPAEDAPQDIDAFLEEVAAQADPSP